MAVNGNKLKGLIRERGYSYRSLAESLKEKGFSIDQSTISNVANNNNNPTLPTIQILYTELEMTPEEGADIFFDTKLHKTGKYKQGV
jgi:transcriptional regulator with XRE-family HTH domain